MRKHLGRGLVIALVLVALTGVPTTSPASADVRPGTKAAEASPQYDDGLAVGTVGADQCARPVAQRSGPWYCPQPSSAVRPGSGFCDVSGCYHRTNDLRADFQSSPGVWGYDRRVLGEMTFYVRWQLAGKLTWSKPVYYKNSVATKDVIFTGDLLNAAPGRDGDPVGGAADLHYIGTVPANTNRAWTPNGFKSFDNTTWDHSQVHQFSWKFGNYPGYWYAWIKSICTHTGRRGEGAIYRFRAEDKLPAHPHGGGWRR
jgi:hypothetical protein